MSVVNLATFKTYVGSRIKADESFLQAVLDAVDVWVAQYCQRSFTVAGSGSARLYVPTGTARLRIHDCTTVTAVTESGTALASTYWQKQPVNLIDQAGQARPIEYLLRLGSTWARTGYEDEATISVTATWGWSAVPAPVTEATKILALDIVGQRDVRGDTEAFGEFGATRSVVRQAERLLGPLRRVEAFGLG